MKPLCEKVEQGQQKVRDSLQSLVNYAMSSFDPQKGGVDSDILTTQAKALTEMTAEVYTGFLLLEQAQVSDHKIPVAQMYVDRMDENATKYASQISRVNGEILATYDAILGIE